MRYHVYYRIEMQLVSPLSVGNGKNEYTDHDTVRGKDGKPYIPASSIAGVFRHTLDNDTALQNRIFGMVEGEESRNSSVIFYDAELIGSAASSVRDCVKLENKVGIDGAKFDIEVVETGARFVTYLELPCRGEDTEADIEKMISGLAGGILRFGTKTSRGYGAVKITSLKKAAFDLQQETQLDEWLDFDLYDVNAWEATDEYTAAEYDSGYIRILLRLIQNGAISIREYSTDADINGETLPDYKHISLSDQTNVIPGQSWAGAFRARYSELAGEAAANELFGYVNENNKEDPSARSRIIFSESIISDSLSKTITRNSIDRFSSAAKDTSLYTEKTCYNGKTELEILLRDNVTDREKGILGAVIMDMHNGFMAVGGLTAVGRGMFTVTGVYLDGEDRTAMLGAENAALLLGVEQ